VFERLTDVDLTAPTRTTPAIVIVRRAALCAYAVVLVWSCVTVGVPIADDRLFVFAVAGLLCASIGRPRRQLRDLVVDWAPFVVMILGYDYSRGWAQRVGLGVHFQPQITADRVLFGGHVPTVWLQEHLYTVVPGPVPLPAGAAQWWEVALQLVYVSHFVAWIAVAAVLWASSRHRFHWYVRRLVTLSYLAFVTYVVFPAAPPWMAAQYGFLPATVGRFGRGLDVIGLRVVGDLVTDGAKTQNQVAAVPSLHFGFALLIVVTLWPHVKPAARRWLAAYPVAMALVLVITGEHYVIDLVLGALYVAASCAVWRSIEARRAVRSFARRGGSLS